MHWMARDCRVFRTVPAPEEEAFLSPWKDSQRAEETDGAEQRGFVKVTSNGPM